MGFLKKERDTKYYFFSGKGGVGKTSCASAFALKMATKGKKTLIISIDPAHSLSDSMEKKIGGEVRKIKVNLYAMEIDPGKAMKEYEEKLVSKLEGMEWLKGAGMDDIFSMAGMTPGIDEIAAFDKFLQFMNSREYDVIVFDTAPTGHTLRFLSLPEVMDSWVGKMIAIRSRMAGMANLMKKFLPFGEEGEETMGTEKLEEMKRRIEEARKIMTDPAKTQYNIVLIPEEMALLETERSLKVLEEYKIPVGSVIVNMIVPKNSACRFCSEKRKGQEARMREIERKFDGKKILKLEQFEREVKGLKQLEKVSERLWG